VTLIAFFPAPGGPSWAIFIFPLRAEPHARQASQRALHWTFPFFRIVLTLSLRFLVFGAPRVGAPLTLGVL